eukprot:TRINITY_DN6087_c0_g1_i1.p1 TRINITY_DN6087_c0_g1~~TRINITY_DN6087_c0_g1_i1.p1  ORF type:complete len:325 (+),score=65.65 TRINITY_DN6087_c0_g1_i1:35-976(+)
MNNTDAALNLYTTLTKEGLIENIETHVEMFLSFAKILQDSSAVCELFNFLKEKSLHIISQPKILIEVFNALAEDSKLGEAMNLFDQLKSLNIPLDDDIYNSVMSVCRSYNPSIKEALYLARVALTELFEPSTAFIFTFYKIMAREDGLQEFAGRAKGYLEYFLKLEKDGLPPKPESRILTHFINFVQSLSRSVDSLLEKKKSNLFTLDPNFKHKPLTYQPSDIESAVVDNHDIGRQLDSQLDQVYAHAKAYLVDEARTLGVERMHGGTRFGTQELTEKKRQIREKERNLRKDLQDLEKKLLKIQAKKVKLAKA